MVSFCHGVPRDCPRLRLPYVGTADATVVWYVFTMESSSFCVEEAESEREWTSFTFSGSKDFCKSLIGAGNDFTIGRQIKMRKEG